MLSNVAQTINELLDSVFVFDEWAIILLKIGIKVWNWAIVLLFRLFKMNLNTFADGAGLEFVERLQPIFLSVASPLLVCFFLYNMYYDSFEEKRNSDFWSIIKLFLPLFLGEVLLANSVTIVSWIFNVGFMMVEKVFSYSPTNLLVDDEKIMELMVDYDIVLGNDIVGGLVLLLLSLITMLVLVICAGILIYTVYFRFLKLYAMIPLSSLAFCTYAGPQELKRVGWMYIKNVAVLALEAVTMLIMVILCNVVLSGGMPEILQLFPSAPNIVILILQYLIIIFNCCLTVGAVKGAETMLSKFVLH